MSSYKTKAIVLGSTNYGESDRIVTFYTSLHGKVKGISRGARRSKRRFINTLEPFSYVRLGFFKARGRGLVRVEYCDLIRTFSGIKEDIKRIALGSSYIELLDNLVGEGEKNLKVFVLMLRFFYALDTAADFEGTMSLFELRLISILGYRPFLNGCVACRRIMEKEGMLLFSPSDGGLICRDCKDKREHLIPLSEDTVKTLKLSLSVRSEKLEDIGLGLKGRSESKRLLRAFIAYQIGKRLKSWKFLDEVESWQTPSCSKDNIST